MTEFLRRVRQRKLWQWSIAYLAAAWLLMEIVDTLGSTWSWPPVVGRLVFVGLSAGFAIALVVAWFHGERGLQRVTGVETVLVLGILVAASAAATLVSRSARDAAGEPDGPIGEDYGDERSLVVLPFADLSPDGEHQYLGDGIAETLINNLGRIPDIHVVARTSAFQFQGGGFDIRDIGRRLGVGSVLDGSVSQVGGRVRVTASLYDARSGLDRWSQQFDESMAAEDLFVLQDRVARAILAALEVELGPGERAVAGGTRSPDAQKAYFLGLHHWTARTTEDIARATDYFLEAIAADSAYADAWAGLALAYCLHIPSEYNVPGLTASEALDRAEAAARRALELDSTLAAPHAALGAALQARGRPLDALREFRLATDKNPGYATAHHWLADLLMSLWRGDEALTEINVAESLDPVAPAILLERAQALMIVGRQEDAAVQVDRALTVAPDAAALLAFGGAWYAIAADHWDRAASLFARSLEARGEPAAGIDWLAGLREPASRRRVLLAIADGEAGDHLSTPVAELLERPDFRFYARLAADGPDAALRYLRDVVASNDRVTMYLPMLPAMMGPELAGRADARELLRTLTETPQG